MVMTVQKGQGDDVECVKKKQGGQSSAMPP